MKVNIQSLRGKALDWALAMSVDAQTTYITSEEHGVTIVEGVVENEEDWNRLPEWKPMNGGAVSAILDSQGRTDRDVIEYLRNIFGDTVDIPDDICYYEMYDSIVKPLIIRIIPQKE